MESHVGVSQTQASSVPEPTPAFEFRASAAEFIAMALFVFVGCGSAMSIAKREGSAWVLQVSLCFGLMITVLAYSIGHYSGGQINCAVTLALWVSGQITIQQAVGNAIAQLLGSVLGALVLHIMYREENDCTGGLGTNSVSKGFSRRNAFIGEFMGTFLLVYVVHEVAVNPLTNSNVALAPLAIGLSVFLAHCVLIPIDGCSINPTRTIGPHIVCRFLRKSKPSWTDMWVFWVGPSTGALAAAGVYAAMHSS